MPRANISNHNNYLPNRLVDESYEICITQKHPGKEGIFHGEDYVGASILPVFMLQVALFFVTSEVIYYLLRPLKQTKVVCNILSGIILGPSVLGRRRKLWDKIFPPEQIVVIDTVALIGAMYFIFLVSIKMDRARIIRTQKNTWVVSVSCLFVPLAICFLLTSLLQSYIPGVQKGTFLYFLSSVMSQTFFSVVAHAITELNLLNSEIGQLAISSAILGEFFSWFNLTMLSIFEIGIKQLIKPELSIIALVLFVLFGVRPTIQWIIRTTPEGKPAKEIYTMTILILPLIMGVLMDIVGSNFISGALLAGLFIPAGSPLGLAIVEKCELIVSTVFMPYFYIRLGQLTNINSITNWREFAVLEMIIIVSYLARVGGSMLSMIFFKMSLRTAIFFGFVLNVKGIVEMLIFMLWRMRKYINDQTLTTVVVSHTVVTAIVTPLLSIYYKPLKRFEALPSLEQRVRTLQTTPIDSELRILCCIHVEANVPSINALLKTFSPSEISPVCAYIVHPIELVGPGTPLCAPYNTNRGRLKETATDRIIRALTKPSKSYGVSLTIQPFILISPYNTMHETICTVTRDKFVPFILVPFHKSYGIQERTVSLRQFNINIQAYAPCTVGIFVDKGLPRFLSSIHNAYDIAVFFLGGPDDREALALATRMSDHPCVSITLLKIDMIPEDHQDRDEIEMLLDEIVIKDFMARNVGNPCVLYQEVEIYEATQLMDALRSIEKNYDLVIVGKWQDASTRFEQEMKPWVEYDELGIIGDMFASPDFCGGMTNVLVIQCVESLNQSARVSVAEKKSRCSVSTSRRDKDEDIFQRNRCSVSSSRCDRVEDDIVVDGRNDPTFCKRV